MQNRIQPRDARCNARGLAAEGLTGGATNVMTDTEILDWIEAHPDYAIVQPPHASLLLTDWMVFDGPACDLHTEVLARGHTLRAAVTAAFSRPYG